MSASPAFHWQSAVRTDVGKVRAVNEDACAAVEDKGVWVVADGMGGHDAGDVASSMIVESVARVGTHERPGELVDELEDRLLDVNQRLHAIAAASRTPMTIGSTVVVFIVLGSHGLCMWAGDSRVYRLREGKLKQLTRDHSQVAELVRLGELRSEEAESHPLANVITRAVGGSAELYLDLELVELHDGDRFVLCSDGLYKELSDQEIAEFLGKGDVQEASSALVEAVLARPARDNVSVAVVEFDAR